MLSSKANISSLLSASSVP